MDSFTVSCSSYESLSANLMSPFHFSGQQPTQAAPQNPRMRSVSMATQEAGDIHVYNNSQIPTPNQVYR